MTGVAAKHAPEAGAGENAPAPRARFLRQFELVERVRAYDPGLDENLINRAYIYATSKHGSQKRHSGDPYFAHPIEVAGILTDYKMDTATIVAGLLHDTIEDTEATREEISRMFGEQIASLVEGVTKLSAARADLRREQAGAKPAEIHSRHVAGCARAAREAGGPAPQYAHAEIHSSRSQAPPHRARKRWKSTAPWRAASVWSGWRASLKASPSTKPSPMRRRPSMRALSNSVRRRAPTSRSSSRRSWKCSIRRAWMRGCSAARNRPIRSGANCSARAWNFPISPTSMRFASSCRMQMTATVRLASCTRLGAACQSSLKTISQTPSPTAIARSTPP